MQIFLIGFMGAGKSHTGRRLAQSLGFVFVDLDQYIQQKAGKSISEIFAAEGEAYFRELERDCLKEQQEESLVVACGGGTPCFFDNMDWMNRQGITIFLDTHPSLILMRLQKGAAKRPLVAGKTREELQGYIEEKLAERRPFYEQASVSYQEHKPDQQVARGLSRHLLQIIGH
ncbi:MAG: shikimate kinase [Bacteroidota bacterium]